MRKLAVVDSQGQALVELILAISIASFFLTTFVVGIISVREAFNRSSVSNDAKMLLQREVEALRSIKETSWNSFSTPGTYHVVQTGGNNWIVAAGTIVNNNLTHGFTVSNVCRLQSTTAPVDCTTAGAVADPTTKKITATVSWSLLGTASISSSLYLTRNFNNTAVTQTSQADFNTGTKVNTTVTNSSGGEVQLATGSVTSSYGNKFIIDTTSSIGNMTNTTLKTSLRFTAQANKTVSAIRVYLNAEVGTSPSYRYGIQTDVGGNPSGTFLGSGFLQATTTGWQTVSISPTVTLTAGTVYHIVVQWFSGTNNTSRYIALRESNPLNSLYPLSNLIDANANTLFNTGSSWVVQNGQPIYELDYSDGTFEGNPYYVQTEIAVAGNTFVGEKFRVTGTDKTVSQISFYVRRNGVPTTNLTVDLWNADTNSLVEEITQPTTTIPTTYNYLTYNFATQRTLVANTNYRIYLKSTGSSLTNGYRINILNATNSANYNGITYDGTNSIYTTSANAGSSWTDTNVNMDVDGFYFTVPGSGMVTSGTFESSTISLAVPGAFNYVSMTTAKPASTTLRLQIASNNDNTTWNYVGPDGTNGTYFDPGGALNLSQVQGQYFRYKAFFTGNGVVTPVLYDATVNYSP